MLPLLHVLLLWRPGRSVSVRATSAFPEPSQLYRGRSYRGSLGIYLTEQAAKADVSGGSDDFTVTSMV